MTELNKLDLEQERKRVRSILRTPEGRAAFEQELGVKFAYSEDKETKPTVAVLIPSHKSPSPQTGAALNAMVSVAKSMANVFVPPSVASSVVHWVRNQCLVNLNKMGIPYTHVLFMDDDMVPSDETLKVMLERDVPVIGAVCTVRQDPPMPNVRVFDEKNMRFSTADIDKPGIYKNVGAVGTGLLLIRKDALDAIAEYTMRCEYEQKYLGMSKEMAEKHSAGRRKKFETTGDAFWFEFLKQPHGDGEFGEDVSLCLKAKECGFEIYADATTKVGHVGDYAYSLEDYWDYRSDLVAQGKVVTIEGGEVAKESQIIVVD